MHVAAAADGRPTADRASLRILIADDHEVIRRGLRQLIEHQAGWEVCGEAATGAAALAQATAQRPDIAILDVSMPESTGLALTRDIHAASPDTELLIFTMNESDEMVRALIDAGARGYVVKSDPMSELVAAIESLATHKPYVTPTISQTVRAAFLDTGSHAAPLSARERQVAQMLADGRSNKEVATALQISPKTVESHRAAIMKKLGLSSIVELVRYAVRNKMISP
jgi:DNA-binding NarL/FixJ family response regulator